MCSDQGGACKRKTVPATRLLRDEEGRQDEGNKMCICLGVCLRVCMYVRASVCMHMHLCVLTCICSFCLCLATTSG